MIFKEMANLHILQNVSVEMKLSEWRDLVDRVTIQPYRKRGGGFMWINDSKLAKKKTNWFLHMLNVVFFPLTVAD